MLKPTGCACAMPKMRPEPNERSWRIFLNGEVSPKTSSKMVLLLCSVAHSVKKELKSRLDFTGAARSACWGGATTVAPTMR